MGTFTLTQQQVGKNFYIYPNGDLSACTEFTAVGDIPNYACVDEDKLTPDDESTYVWWDGIAAGLDLYETQDHTTEAGVINYIQVYARAKSHELTQDINGTYKIICSPDSTCSHVYKSDNINLTTGYSTYSKVWTVNPHDSNTWEWADIDALCIGAECKSPAVFCPSLSLVLRPTGDSAVNLVPYGEADNYKCVYEAIANEDTDYVASENGVYVRDDYDLQNTTETGTISSIAIFARVRATGYIQKALYGIGVKIGATEDFGPGGYYDSNRQDWHTFSKEWVVNPDTGVAWTWANINALVVLLRMRGYTAATDALCTQYYVIVYYDKTVSPEIHTTQCYAKINYSTEKECSLQIPNWVGLNHDRNIKMLNFWNGTREVYDLNRSGKSTVFTGSEMNSGACNRIICTRDLARNGAIVTITGLSLGYYNGSYRIRSFGWNKISEKPEHYKWVLDLEQAD